jgi:katanin p60 ATPase-containing subunit A1
MGRECNLGLDKWDVADNIDLYFILKDFEEFYEMKFLKPVTLVRKSMG